MAAILNDERFTPFRISAPGWLFTIRCLLCNVDLPHGPSYTRCDLEIPGRAAKMNRAVVGGHFRNTGKTSVMADAYSKASRDFPLRRANFSRTTSTDSPGKDFSLPGQILRGALKTNPIRKRSNCVSTE
jgi:hypothetical protein